MLLRLISLLLATLCAPLRGEMIQQSRAFATLGEPKYAPGFRHFDYVDPASPKSGRLTMAVVGTFGNFNRYASRGNPGAGTETLYDRLFTSSDDEPDSYYPLIAESARYASDFRWMEIRLNPRAGRCLYLRQIYARRRAAVSHVLPRR
nr:putative cyclic-di-GMP phosphodiesterase AdrB [Candidatus Pantoea persica]